MEAGAFHRTRGGDAHSPFSAFCHDTKTPLCCCCCTKGCQHSTARVANTFFGSQLIHYWRLVLVLSNSWFVCFLATSTGHKTKDLHAIITSTMIVLHLGEILLQASLQGPLYFSSLARRVDTTIVFVATAVFIFFYGPAHCEA